MFEKSFLIVREEWKWTDLTRFSNETTDKCWSSLCSKKEKQSRGIHYISTREMLRSFHLQGWYTKHSRVRFLSCANPFLFRKVTLELHSSNSVLHKTKSLLQFQKWHLRDSLWYILWPFEMACPQQKLFLPLCRLVSRHPRSKST